MKYQARKEKEKKAKLEAVAQIMLQALEEDEEKGVNDILEGGMLWERRVRLIEVQ